MARRDTAILVMIAIALAVAVVGSRSTPLPPPDKVIESNQELQGKQHSLTVHYQVFAFSPQESKGRYGRYASLTYTNTQGHPEQQGTVELPWELTLTVQPGFSAYISAQNLAEFGPIVAQIEATGYQTQRSQSNGQYAIATASERLQ